MTTVRKACSDLQNDIEVYFKSIKYLESIEHLLPEDCEFQYMNYSKSLLIEAKDRDEAMKLMLNFGGRFEKEFCSYTKKMQYRKTYLETNQDITISTDPPPSCHIVEEEVEVAEEVIPAHKVKKVSIICNEVDQAQVSEQAELNPTEAPSYDGSNEKEDAQQKVERMANEDTQSI